MVSVCCSVLSVLLVGGALIAQGDALAAARQKHAAAVQRGGAASLPALEAQVQLGAQLLKAGQLAAARDELLQVIVAAEGAAQPAVEATARHALSAVLLDLREGTAAREQARTALSLRRRLLPAGHVSIAEACNALAAAEAEVGDLTAARSLLAEALASYERAPGQGMKVAMLASNLAAIAARDNDFPGAIEQARRAVAAAVAARGAEDRTSLQLRANLGRALVLVGRLDEARRELEPVVAAQRQQLGARHLRTFETEHTLLGLRMTVMPEESALAPARELAAIAAELFGQKHQTTAAVQRLLIEAQLRSGDLAAALAGIEALAAVDAGPSMQRSLQLLRARVLAELGRHDEALAIGAELERGEPTADLLSWLYETTQIARLHAVAGQRREAIRRLQQALANPDHVMAPTLPVVRWRNLLAELLVAEGEHRAALQFDVETLRTFGEALDATLPSLLESERLRQKAELQACLDRLLAGDLAHPGELPAAVVCGAVLAWKGCVGRELEADLASLRGRNEGPQRARQDRLQQLQRALGELLERGAAGGEAWQQLQRQRSELLAALSGDGAATERAPIVEVAAVQRALPKHSAAVEFVRWQAAGGAVLSAFVVRADRVERVELGALAPIEQAVTSHLLLLGRRQQALDAAAAAIAAAAGARLAALVWSPLLPRIDGCERVHLAPDDCLSLLPFDSLPGTTAGSFVLEQFDVRTLRSTGDLLLPERLRSGGLVLVDGGAADLPGARAEVAAIAALWREPNGATGGQSGRGPLVELVGADAAALARAVPQAEFVHIASHGRYRSGDGGNGASFELAGQRLSAAELAFFDLARTRLVVLSACDTARGEVLAGEPLLGLRRGLRLAGAAASLTALWRIDDAATAALMTTFWRELLTHGDPALALRTAKLATLAAARAGAGDPLPGHWAAFVLEGR